LLAGADGIAAENQGISMAIEPATNESPEDFKAHTHDYLEFTRLIKYGAITALVVGFFVLLIL
jgi:hypothetical protein